MLLWLLLARAAQGLQTAPKLCAPPGGSLAAASPAATVMTPLGADDDADPCWSEAAAAVSHNSYLPERFNERIRPREKVALGFLLAFLESEKLPAQLLLSGGYVRDLLLGMSPVDLDVSLCLRECPSSTTLCTIVSALPAFAEARPELGVSAVSIIDTLSDAARAKCVETAKVRLQVGEASVAVMSAPKSACAAMRASKS